MSTTNNISSGPRTLSSATIVSTIVTSMIVLFVEFIALKMALGYWAEETAKNPSLNGSNQLGQELLIINFLILFFMVSFTRLAFWISLRITKHKSFTLVLWTAFGANFVVGALVYLPFFGGRSLAPTAIYLFSIPIRYLVIIIGVLIVPFLSAFNAALAKEPK